MVMFERKSCSPIVVMSIESMRIFPRVGSIIRKSANVTELLPKNRMWHDQMRPQMYFVTQNNTFSIFLIITYKRQNPPSFFPGYALRTPMYEFTHYCVEKNIIWTLIDGKINKSTNIFLSRSQHSSNIIYRLRTITITDCNKNKYLTLYLNQFYQLSQLFHEIEFQR